MLSQGEARFILKMKLLFPCLIIVVSSLHHLDGSHLFLHLFVKGQRRNEDECDCSSLVRQRVVSSGHQTHLCERPGADDITAAQKQPEVQLLL